MGGTAGNFELNSGSITIKANAGSCIQITNTEEIS